MTVYFHGSFGLNRKFMAGLLHDALTHPAKTSTELAEPFGYKAPFANRYKSWLHKTGLIKPDSPIQLTQGGQIVYGQDPQLKSLVSIWFMHHALTADPENAEVWHWFDKEFLPQHSEFSKSGLEMGVANQLMPHDEKHFAIGSTMTRVIVRKLIDCYTSSEALGGLGVVVASNSGSFLRGNPKILGPWKTVPELRAAVSAE